MDHAPAHFTREWSVRGHVPPAVPAGDAVEDALAAYRTRLAGARCLVYDLERERTRQAFAIKELNRRRVDTGDAHKTLDAICRSLDMARKVVDRIETDGLIRTERIPADRQADDRSPLS